MNKATMKERSAVLQSPRGFSGGNALIAADSYLADSSR